MARTVLFKLVLTLALTLAGLPALAGGLGDVRLAPVGLRLESSKSLPAEAAQQEADSVARAFDRSTTTALGLFDAATVIATLEPGARVSALRFYGASPYVAEISVGVTTGGDTKWTAVPKAKRVDLSALPADWSIVSLGAFYAADQIRLRLDPIAGVSGDGLAEVEFWGEGAHAVVADGVAAFTALGGTSAKAQLRLLPVGEAALSAAAPTASLAFDSPFAPTDIRRAWLRYEVKGVAGWMGVRRSLNGRGSLGGYVAANHEDWVVQVEEISPDLLARGKNTLQFGTLSGFERYYDLRAAAVVVELDDGHTLLADIATGLAVPRDVAGLSVLELPFVRQASARKLGVTFAAPFAGQVSVEARVADGTWQSAGVSKVPVGAKGKAAAATAYVFELAAPEAGALRMIVDHKDDMPIVPIEAVAAGSVVGAHGHPPALTLTWPANGEYYGRTGLVRGFVRPGAGAPEIYVAGLPFAADGGEFEIAITKDQAGFMGSADEAPWSVEVVALYADGERASRTVTFNRQENAANLAGDASEVEVNRFEAGAEKSVKFEQAELTVTAEALEQDQDIHITALGDIELVKLDTGLVNVTRGPRRGYRMLPHMKFKAHVKLKLPYDKNLIPEGYGEADIRLYYFDAEAGRWVALEGSAADAASEMVGAQTSHFTDFIAGVLTAPDSPEAASNSPNQFKDMKAADPLAKVNLIAPPEANATGAAALSYPFELPPGRQGATPQLALTYSSQAGNDWLGLGWSLSAPSISIDTRWGVPRYSASEETETYLWNGQQLTPMAHRGALVPRAAERTFHARVEGGFSRIVRHGTGPANYWWEVTDKSGVRFAYGGDLTTGQRRESAVLTDDAGNVFKWALTEIRDPNGNNITYSHVTVVDSGLALGSTSGRQLYPEKIEYTGDAGGPGPFLVRFIRDRELAGFAPRRDRIVDGRGGFKMVTADLLRRVEVSYAGSLVRAYELNYREGAYFKQILTGVTQLDADNRPFNTHSFDYYDDARKDGAYHGFAAADDWRSPDDNVRLGGLLSQRASALSGVEGSNFDWHLFLGIGFPNKHLSIGAKFGGSGGSSDGKLFLIDLNGDGLSDKVFMNGSGIYMRANESGPGGDARFAAAPIRVVDLPALMHETSSTSSRGIEAYFGASLGVNWSDSVATSDIYFTDGNGDGLPDLNFKGRILFNILNEAGVPTFSPDSAGSAYPVGAAAIDAAALDMDFDALFAKMAEDSPLVDNVRSWTAPHAGDVQITGSVALRQVSSPERAAYQTADGVRVAIEHDGAELYTAVFGADETAPKTPALAPIHVDKGDVVYFRVQSRFDGAYDSVDWAPVIAYQAAVPAIDANGLSNATYDATADFVGFSDKPAAFAAPFDGTVTVSATLNKQLTTDDVDLQLLLNGAVVASRALAWDAAGAMPISFTTNVRRAEINPDTREVTREADTLQLRLVVPSRIDLRALHWSSGDMPRIWYTASSDARLPADAVFDEAGAPATLQPLPAQTDIYSQSDLTAPLAGWTAPESGNVDVTPHVTLAAGQGALDTSIVLTVKSGGARVAKAVIPVVDGAVSGGSFAFTAQAGQSYFFEFASPTPDIVAAIAESGATVTLPSTANAEVPTAFYGAERTTLLAEPYRGWRSFGYNGNNERAEHPIAISESDIVGPSAEEQAAFRQDLEAAIDQGQPNDELVDAAKRNVYPFSPGGTEAASALRWVSGDAELWSEAGVQSASRFGANYLSVPDVRSFAGGQAVPRISHTNAFSGMGGVLFASGSFSNTSTVSVLDFLDLNGDRFPDVLSGDRMVQYSPMTGGLEGQARVATGMQADIRATDGRATSLGIGGTFPKQGANGRGHIDTRASGGSTGSTGTLMASLGFSGSVTKGDSEIRHDLNDLNGDGLPDLVRTDGSTLWVRFNIGYGFAAEELFGASSINSGSTQTTSLGVGFNDGIFGFAGGLSGSQSESLAIKSLADVNGDGLLDAVSGGGSNSALVVRLNSGSGFEPAMAWNTGGQGTLVSSAASASGSAGFYFTIPIPFIIINPGADFGVTANRLERSIQDIDGNGYPEYLHSEADGQLRVSYDTVGRTNLLKTVHRPGGAVMTLDYERSGNRVAQPHSLWVMKRVEVFDGFTGDGADTLATAYRYEDGLWDREEREFYGYGRVVATDLDTAAAGGEAAYRVATHDYLNKNFYEKGLLARSALADGQGRLYSETRHSYRFVDIDNGAVIARPDSLTATIFPQLVRTETSYFEGQAAPGKSTYQTFDYDDLGNVTRFADAANLDVADDDVESRITYRRDLAAYIVDRAEAVSVLGNGRVMRERHAEFDARGNMVRLDSRLGDGGAAVSDFVYDSRGNLVAVTGPANDNGQRYRLDYGYDSEVATYVVATTDSFGYGSSARYDVRFGSMVESIDLNRQPIAYSLDSVGRVVSVTGPYQNGTGLDTIRFAYFPRRDVPGAADYPDVDLSYARTLHLDVYRDPNDPIETVLFADGLGRVLQTKRDATILAEGQPHDRMVASGRVGFDALGRANVQYYPVAEPLNQADRFNAAYDTIAPTLTDYDVLDRPVRVTIPDGTATGFTYDFGADRDGRLQFRTSVIDAEGQQRETYADVRSLTTAVTEHNPAGGQATIWTSYGYDPLRQIIRVTDDKGNFTGAEYDNFGRMTALDNKDTGRTTFGFDLASNLTSKQTAVLREAGAAITYDYTFGRLDAVAYPLFAGNNVAYTYGGPDAPHNRANRIVTVTSGAGQEERFYGPLGELTRQIRTVNSDTGAGSTGSAETYTTSWTYDSWNRLQSMVYPDGEVLTNRYDSGGMLRQIDGRKGSYDYAYLKQLGYDKFGQRTYLAAGNGAETRYAYLPETRRLTSLVAQAGPGGRVFQDLSYGYDLVGNIVSLANSAAVRSANQFGGATAFSYGYDDLYRLTTASGVWHTAPLGTSESFTLSLGYDSLHNIAHKTQAHIRTTDTGEIAPQHKTTYDWAYAYGDRPHGASQIGGRAFSYDANGNQLGWSDLASGTRRENVWDDENRLHTLSDNGQTQTYKYDDAGDRIVKRGPQGETAYINQYYTVRNREAGTKHVFAGAQRLVSKLQSSAVSCDTAPSAAAPGGKGKGGSKGGGKGGSTCTSGATDVFEKDHYYFHPDHLGSSAYVTDVDGEIFQHLEYFPFGETFVEEHSSRQRSPYLFSGKELDEETGLYYFGARYYDPRTSVWQNPDPILADYLGGSPAGGVFQPANLNLYGYVHNRPVVAIDPNGKWFAWDDAIASGLGVVIGVTVQVGVDVWHGELSSWKDYTAAAVSGAVTGETALYTANPWAAGAAGGAAHSLTRNGLDGKFDLVDTARSTLLGAVGGKAGELAGTAAGKVAGAIGARIGREAIPTKAWDVLAHVKQTGNAPAGYKGGRVFQNDGRQGGQVLPKADSAGKPVTYLEYDVNPQQQGVNRGLERLVRGSDGSAHYTNDHYSKFTQME